MTTTTSQNAGSRVFPAFFWIGLGVLASAFLVAHIEAITASTSKGARVARMMHTYSTLHSVVHDLWMGSPNYGAAGSDMVPAIIMSGQLPVSTSMDSATAKPMVSLRGDYGDIAVSVSDTNAHQWVATYPAELALPKAVCFDFVSGILPFVRSATVAGFVHSMTVAGTTVTTAADAAANCADGVDIAVTSD